MDQQHSIPAVVNSHAHSPYGPHYEGVIAAQPFEPFMLDLMARQQRDETPEEAKAFALVTGLENLSCGSTTIIDQCFLPLTPEHYHGVAGAYEELGMRGWVFSELNDLPNIAYTREAYPGYPGALPMNELPEALLALCEEATAHEDQLHKLAEIIRGWQGEKVRIGVGISNPVWCSDELMRGAADLARTLRLPVNFHAEESPIQRQVHMAQWGMSGIERAAALGLLTPDTLVTHVVQVSDRDIAIMAESGCSVSHNPISNLKIRNGIAPIGKMLAAGINVCLGCDGQSSGDTQNLFTVVKFVCALSELNGIASLAGRVEDMAIKMAIENGRRLWLEGDLRRDIIELHVPVDRYGFAWDDPASRLAEVYVDGSPRLELARKRVSDSGALEIVSEWRAAVNEPGIRARAESLAGWIEGKYA